MTPLSRPTMAMFLPGYGIMLGLAIAAVLPAPTRCAIGWSMAALHLAIVLGLNYGVYRAKDSSTDSDDRVLQSLVFGSGVSVGCLTIQWSTLFHQAHNGNFAFFAVFFLLLSLAVKSMNVAIATLVRRDIPH